MKCLDYGGCIFEQVKVPVIVMGCKLDLLDEQQKFKLKDFTSYVLKQNPEIEICIETSTKENIRVHLFILSCFNWQTVSRNEFFLILKP